MSVRSTHSFAFALVPASSQEFNSASRNRKPSPVGTLLNLAEICRLVSGSTNTCHPVWAAICARTAESLPDLMSALILCESLLQFNESAETTAVNAKKDAIPKIRTNTDLLNHNVRGFIRPVLSAMCARIYSIQVPYAIVTFLRVRTRICPNTNRTGGCNCGHNLPRPCGPTAAEHLISLSRHRGPGNGWRRNFDGHNKGRTSIHKSYPFCGGTILVATG